MSSEKKEIIKIFKENVKGKKADVSKANKNHDGKKGHWLESQMGVSPNSDNMPDLLGYELKNETTSKTTFGDWSPNYFIFKDKDQSVSRKDFICTFGKYNEKKDRYSWSGEPVPKIDRFNKFGQKLFVDSNNNVIITYSYKEDLRTDKVSIVPKELQIDDLILAKWDNEILKDKFERKFSQKGWFTCKTNKDKIYESIHFGPPMNYNSWIEDIKKGIVIFDSGMYHDEKKKNIRPYASWRASNKYWNNLLTDSY